MNINLNFKNKLNVEKKVSFGSGMSPRTVKYLLGVNVRGIEDKLTFAKGVQVNFSENKLLAGLVNLASRVCEELNINLPPQINVVKFTADKTRIKSLPKAKAVGLTYRCEPRILDTGVTRKFGVEFNDDYFRGIPEIYDVMCNHNQKLVGNTHFLNYIIHEFLHSDFFARTNSSMIHYVYNKRGLNRFMEHYTPKPSFSSDIFYITHNLEPFRREVETVIAPYAMTNPLELQATYWAKEVCQSLDGNLRPRYNPFETPAIQLSPLLRSFITYYNNGDMKTARDISKIAARLNS